ncbi:hypothetical protein [Hungatella hathewayi]|uniref:hypothetical protein n=1 Tax=Hungatella hathewayi TaxID=154046 RepID=UPI0035617845
MKKIVRTGLITILACFVLSGCTGVVETTEVATKKTMTSEKKHELLDDKIGEFENGKLTMEVDIPNESFTLKAVFKAEDYTIDRWRTTDVKTLNLSACTVELPENTEVFIDNVHIDTVIKSLYAAYDAIPIDTMDDRTHSSLVLGFPITDSMSYNGIFAIGGYSDMLIEGFTSGYSTGKAGYNTGYIKESRVTESVLRNSAVYANMFQIVWDLWIQKPGNKYPYMTSVKTEFLIPTEFKQGDYIFLYNGKTFDAVGGSGNKREYKYSNGNFISLTQENEAEDKTLLNLK